MRAVVFDYGEVLCRPNPVAHQALLDTSGVDRATFEQHYWQDRHDYDLGCFDGTVFWSQFAQRTGRTFTPGQLRALIENDVLMWTTVLIEPMLAWAAALHASGLATAILSNMPFEIAHAMRQKIDWLPPFDHLTFSCELRLAKPDPAIYAFTCDRLGVRPHDTLFLDDKPVNVEAARSFGMRALQFRNVDQLRRDLAAESLLTDLPPLAEPRPSSPCDPESQVSA